MEARNLVSSAVVEARLSRDLELFKAVVPEMAACLVNSSLSTVMDKLQRELGELEEQVDALYHQEATSESTSALKQKHNAAATDTIRAAIQSRIETGSSDAAARLCLQAIAASVDVKDQLVELVFEVCRVRDEAVFEEARNGRPIARVLAEVLPEKRTPNGYAALHEAAEKHHFHLVELLLVHADMDPLAQESARDKRPIELIGAVGKDEREDDEIRRILYLLQECTSVHEVFF